MGEYGVRQRVQWQSSGAIGIGYGLTKLDGAGYTVYRGDQCTALQGRIHDARIERFVRIASVLHIFTCIGSVSLCLPPSQCLVSYLVQQVCPAQTDKQHFQQRVLDEHARHDTRYRQQIVFQTQRLRLAGEYTQQNVG